MVLNIPEFDDKTHSYTVKGNPLPSVTEIINSVMGVNPFWTDAARDSGTATHKAIQYYAENDIDISSLADETKRRLDAYILFCNDYQWKPDIIERPLFHPKYKYAGTPDQIQTGRAVIDFKNGAHLPQYALQTAAYANMLPNPLIYDRMTVQLCDDGSYKMQAYKKQSMTADFNTFLSCLNIHNWRMVNGIK